MQELLTPIKTESLKEVFVTRFEALILSGQLSIGQKLPSERELAFQLNVSRPVVHEGLVDLAAKGLVTLRPRSGAVVNDYRKYGSPDILNSLFNYHKGKLEPGILNSILSIRILFEVETASLAALERTEEQIASFEILLQQEKKLAHTDLEGLVEVDFEFHHLITIASGNLIYPLLLNSMKKIYTNLTRQFFEDSSVVKKTFRYHREMITAIKAGDDKSAVHIMKKILEHGERHVNQMINGKK